MDFDVHHGNGTQHYFYDSSKVLYISIHRYENAKFYPKSKEGNYNFVGVDDGEGYNVNIPLNAVSVVKLLFPKVCFIEKMFLMCLM